MTAVSDKSQPMSPGPKSIEIEIAGLADLDLDALRTYWRNHFGRAAPKTLPRAFLARLIGYRRQAEVLGDLDPKSIQMLKRLAGANIDGGKASQPKLARSLPPPGTMLLREWNGQMHRVSVMQDGFAWNGVVYASLSRVAREITGVSWNGFVFFGLTQKAKAPSHQTSNQQCPHDQPGGKRGGL